MASVKIKLDMSQMQGLTAMAEEADHVRDLLRRYVEHVRQIKGMDYLDVWTDSHLTPEDCAEIVELTGVKP